MATISDVAKKCKCSIATVSKVFNHTGNISEETRKKILKVAEQLQYVPSSSARALARTTKTSNLIGILLHIHEDRSITHELFSNILNSFRIEMEKNDYDICFVRSIEESSNYEYMDYINSRGIDGIFILSADPNLQKIQNLLKSDIPLVTFDNLDFKFNISSDNYNSVIALVDELVKNGHKAISFVSPKDYGVSLERRKGFIDGLKKNNIPFDPRMIIRGPFYCSESAKIATDLALASGINPTAIMYPDDYTAISAIPYLRGLGKKVPLNMSLTGFDGVEIANSMRPRIVTVKQDSREIGLQAANLLLYQINHKGNNEYKITVKTSVTIGDTILNLKK